MATWGGPKRIDALARQLGLTPPKPEQFQTGREVSELNDRQDNERWPPLIVMATVPRQRDANVPRKRQTRRRTETGVLRLAVFFAFAEVAIQLVALRNQPPAERDTRSLPSRWRQASPSRHRRSQRPAARNRHRKLHRCSPIPRVVLDRDEVVEKLATVLPDLDAADLRRALADRTRRFVWVRRGAVAAGRASVHNLGLPGLSFRNELRRAYPGGAAGGPRPRLVNVDNKGVSGIEKYIDDKIGVEPVHAATLSTRAPVRLSLDIGVQHALEDELESAVVAMRRRRRWSRARHQDG